MRGPKCLMLSPCSTAVKPPNSDCRRAMLPLPNTSRSNCPCGPVGGRPLVGVSAGDCSNDSASAAACDRDPPCRGRRLMQQIHQRSCTSAQALLVNPSYRITLLGPSLLHQCVRITQFTIPPMLMGVTQGPTLAFTSITA